MILFSELPDKLNYPKLHKRISTMHSDIVSYYLDMNCSFTKYDRLVIVDMLNKASYKVLVNDFIPKYESAEELIDFLSSDVTDKDEIDDYLSRMPKLYVDYSCIKWDISESNESSYKLEDFNSNIEVPNIQSSGYVENNVTDNVEDNQDGNESESIDNVKYAESAVESVDEDAHHSSDISSKINDVESNPYVGPSINIDRGSSTQADLSIQGPRVPRFDFNHPFLYQNDGSDTLAIYTTLPLIPNKQCQISCTTDINLMSDSDFNCLFPDTILRTRSDTMYNRKIAEENSLEYDDKVGILLPIDGFTIDQIRDNVVRYPHFFQLKKWSNGKIVNFYSTVEIDGSLHRISDIWSILEDTKHLPKTKDFMKEYVVRRYLLERDNNKLEHKYPMLGSLDPFMTLFMPASEYVRYGYDDSISLAMNCVKSRVEYHRSRNPILRRLKYYA